MTVTNEIKTAVAKKITACRRASGMRFETVCHGFDKSKTVEIVYAILELVNEGVIEIHECQFADGFGWKMDTTYRPRFA